jgi:hypothetical protein
MNPIVGTETGRTHFHVAKGTEPMTFSKEFQEAVRTVRTIKTDLSQVERRLAEDLCQKQDKHIATALLAKLASP